MNVKNSTKKPVSGLAFFISALCIAWIAWPDEIGAHRDDQSGKPVYTPRPYRQQETQIQKAYLRYPRTRKPSSTHDRPPFLEPKYSQASALSIDINEADSIDWVQVPGIGPKTAHRIIARRNKLHGFHAVSQLLEVYYFDSNLLQSSRVAFQVRPQSWAGIIWDSATRKEDLYHPYLSPSQRNSLWAYKAQHPEFHPLRNPKPLCIDSATWYRIYPYWK